MSDTVERLREELKDPEYSEGYAESFLDSYIATQIKVLREQAGLSQQALATMVGTRQAVISRIENVNYSKWNISTLKKLACAFRVRLRVSFETYGSMLAEVASFSRSSLQREPREADPVLNANVSTSSGARRHFHRRFSAHGSLSSRLSNHSDARLLPGANNYNLGSVRSQIHPYNTMAERAQRPT